MEYPASGNAGYQAENYNRSTERAIEPLSAAGGFFCGTIHSPLAYESLADLSAEGESKIQVGGLIILCSVLACRAFGRRFGTLHNIAANTAFPFDRRFPLVYGAGLDHFE